MTRLPPARVVRAATALRTALQGVTRRMVPPEIALLELASGFMATHAVHAAARLGLADVLARGPRSAYDVAAEAGSDPDATHRLLRACAALGVFREEDDGRFGMTPLAQPLRSDSSDSMRAVILMLGDPVYQGTWAQLPATVETGRPGVEALLGRPLWEHLDHDPAFAATFHHAMTRLTDLDWPAVEAAYDFSRFSTIADLGGGQGHQLALLLGASPTAKGVLLEREALAREAEEHLRAAGVLARCRIKPGSFFETAPADADLYVMRRVVHDFDDEEAVAILANVRRHMPAGATLLLMESVVPPGNGPHFAKSLDLDMLLFVGGRERTEREWATLLDRAGLRLTRIVPTLSTLSLIEAVPGRPS